MSITAAEFPIHLVIAGVLAVSLLFRGLATKVGQPQVVGEILAGLVVGLGLSTIGHQIGMPDVLFQSLSSSLNLLGNFGLVFLVMNALFNNPSDLNLSKEGKRTVLYVTLANVLPSFIGGGWLGYQYAMAHAIETKSAFILLVSVASSMSAVPVLARILSELKLSGTRAGQISFRSACWTDAIGWMCVGVALALHSQGDAFQFAMTRLLVTGIVLAALFGIRHLIRRYPMSSPSSSNKLLLIVLLVTAGVTHLASLHLVFGAFLVGSVFAGEKELTKNWLKDSAWMTDRFFCPLFFAVAGMNLQSVGSVSSQEVLWGLGFLTLCIFSKLIPLMWMGSRLGMSRQESTLLALLLNTRGLMELVILSIGLHYGIFSPIQYSIFVIVAVVTTIITMPLCRLVLTRQQVIA
jgi:Kef-type K+ transport system membrane component KefB